MKGKVKVAGPDLMCFSVDTKTYEPLAYSIYDPYIREYPWHDIEEEGPPPESNKYYLVFTSTGLITISLFTRNHHYFDNHPRTHILPEEDYGKWSKYFQVAREGCYRITHWAYLPPKPNNRR